VREEFWIRPVSVSAVGELFYQMFLRPEYLPAPPQQQLLWTLGVCVVALTLLIRGADWRDGLVLCLSLGPLAFCLLVSTWDVPILSLRYFLPAHVFLLVGLAALVRRIRFLLERTIVAGALLGIFIAVDVDFWHAMDLPNKPGARGAAAFLGAHRRANEPVIASMPFFYFSLLHDAREREGHYLFTDGTSMPHYYGTAALDPNELICSEDLSSIRTRRVWVVNLEGGFLASRVVPVPEAWLQRAQWTFRDVFDLGTVQIIEYETILP
jgi:hypothetical protein